MLTITALPALHDNYIWLIQAGNEAICIDPSQADPVLDYVQHHRLHLSQIWATHLHHDHIGGIAALRQAFPHCRVYGNDDIALATEHVGENSTLTFAHYHVHVWQVAGHTDKHLAFIVQDSTQYHVFCGDTLFSAGCGRVFTGTIEQLYHSIQRFNTLPSDTLLYPAHEYTVANLRFAAHIEPNNDAIQTAFVRAQSLPTLPVRLADEQHINPFLRLNQPTVQQRVAELSQQPLNTPLAVFAALRALKNDF